MWIRIANDYVWWEKTIYFFKKNLEKNDNLLHTGKNYDFSMIAFTSFTPVYHDKVFAIISHNID